MDMAKPIIRFKGYQDDWEQRKFGEIVEKYEDPVETPTEGYTRLGIRSHAKGTFHSFVEKGKELETAKMFRVAADKFIVNITFGWEHAVAITDENDAGKLVSHRFPQYSFNAGMVPKFFRYLILDENFKHHLELSSPGGAGRNRVLKLSDMLEYKMNFPSEAEQKKIAAYFDDLDHLITLHQRKCDETKRLKKYMLQKMFPQNGEKVPEIRFTGFTDDWEQRKLSELLVERNVQHSQSEEFPLVSFTVENGVTPKTERYEREQLVRGDKSAKKYKETRLDDIVYNPANLKFGAISRNKLGNAVFSPIYVTFEVKKDLVKPSFIEMVVTRKNFIQKALQYQQGTVYERMAVNTEDFTNLDVYIPNGFEQEKIGNYFENLDHLITLHQRELENLQNIKKFMLGKMFV